MREVFNVGDTIWFWNSKSQAIESAIVMGVNWSLPYVVGPPNVHISSYYYRQMHGKNDVRGTAYPGACFSSIENLTKHFAKNHRDLR